MQINRKLTDREQRLLSMLADEKAKAMKEIGRLMDKDNHDIRSIVDSAEDDADRSAMDENKEIDWTLIRTYNEKVKSIEDAILSLTREEYGFCQSCGQPIAEKRLEALPFVRYCINCQKKVEQVEEIEK
jgi:DnaK suppressor protein